MNTTEADVVLKQILRGGHIKCIFLGYRRRFRWMCSDKEGYLSVGRWNAIFTGLILTTELSIPSKDPGCWDSIHVFEALDRARKAHYKLTSTIILDMSSKMDPGGTLDLSGNLVRQVEQDMPVENDGRHIVNIGKASTRSLYINMIEA